MMPLCLTRHTQKEILSLNGLRGIAILLVLLYHNFAYFQITYFGWVGVDLFFVLSGFLITRILLSAKESDHYFKNFYIRRALRIFPLYYLSILIFLFIEHALPLPATMSFSNHLDFYLSYFQNLLYFQKSDQPLGHSILNHLWSLSVEEHFYILWPWFVFYLTEKQLVRTGVIIIIASKLLSLILLKQGMSWVTVYTFSFVRFETLMMGALLAILISYRVNLIEKYTKWIFALSGILILAFLGYYIAVTRSLSILNPDECVFMSQSFILTTIALFFSSVLVFALADNKFEKLLSSNTLIFLGKYSYGIYIFHYPIYYIAIYYFHRYTASSLSFDWLTEILISLACSCLALCVAYISYNYYEKYFLSLKSKFPNKISV